MKAYTLLPLLAFTAASADVTLPPLISDNMLLQQPKAAIWGKANPGEEVLVTLGKTRVKATTGEDGKWRAELKDLKPGLAGDLTVAARNTITVRNVAVGEVWVGSGQSNMEMTVVSGSWCRYGGALNAEKEAAEANTPEIRMFTVRKLGSETLVDDVQGKWEVCAPENVPHWSATGYFFARQLHRDLKLPIGMITSASGGSSAQAWTPVEILQADPDFSPWLVKRQKELAEYPQAKEKYDKELFPAWQAAAEAAKAAGQPVPKRPAQPMGPGEGSYSPSMLYNGLMHGVTQYSIKGVVWYQGEANVGDSIRYRKLLPAMIDSWRKAWNQPDLPFYQVQLAGWRARKSEPVDSNWADLREAQREIANKVPHTGLAVAVDIGDEKNIHPANKQEVGRRLALIAEAQTYGKPVAHTGPAFDKAENLGPGIEIAFKPGTAAGLVTTDGAPIQGFAIAGEDKRFVWAEAQIIGGAEPKLVISSPQVLRPVAVRYAWANTPTVNLVNLDGLPAVPFRTDDWPQVEPPEAP